ncbi:MAG TPA: homoserine O-acetyltransferase [Micromonosporaceae bacterium]
MALTQVRGGTGSSAGPAAGNTRRYAEIGDLILESGRVLPDVRLAYETWGTLNAAGDNAVLVLHALTGDSHVVGPAGPDQPTPGWWDGLIGPGAPLDDGRYFVVAANVLGGCRGSTGPSTPAPDGRPWGSRFPRLTVRDQVAAEAALADLLGIRSFAAVLGGSMGGMRALEWSIMYPERVRRCIAIATTPYFSGDQIAWSAPQLAAIRSDPSFRGGDYYDGTPPLAGMAVARQIAHITYRSAGELNARFGRDPQPGEDPAAGGRFAVQSYLDHHGDKLCRRFDPNSYLVLTEAMMSHDIGRGRGGVDAALAVIRAELTVAVVDSDRLFPPEAGAVLATAPTARPLITIRSAHGHDGFLIEAEQVAAVVRSALATYAELANA